MDLRAESKAPVQAPPQQEPDCLSLTQTAGMLHSPAVWVLTVVMIEL
jgi:hypothetical protein